MVKSNSKDKDISAAVNELCLWFPETEEVISHGTPDYRVQGKTFATYCINHHGDDRIALWLHAPAGAQAFYTKPQSGKPAPHDFVPPYVGTKGWLGVQLDTGLNWDQIASLTREAYETVAPARLLKTLGSTISIEPPTKTLDPEDFDPLNNAKAQKSLKKLRAKCLALPETHEDTSFGDPNFRAGKKSFCGVHRRAKRMRLTFWVGGEAQAMLSADPRYRIPAYSGRNGWIELDVEKTLDWVEIDQLLLASYRHFALQRMLKALESG